MPIMPVVLVGRVPGMTLTEDGSFQDEICSRIRDLRMLRGLTQVDMAQALGVGQDVYSRYEQGIRARGWPIELLVGVADALGVPLVALVPGQRVVCDSCGSARGRLGHARISAPND